MDGRSRVTVPQIAAKVAQVKRDDAFAAAIELGLVVLDHLDYIAASRTVIAACASQEISEIVLGLKDVARSLGVCVLLLSPALA